MFDDDSSLQLQKSSSASAEQQSEQVADDIKTVEAVKTEDTEDKDRDKDRDKNKTDADMSAQKTETETEDKDKDKDNKDKNHKDISHQTESEQAKKQTFVIPPSAAKKASKSKSHKSTGGRRVGKKHRYALSLVDRKKLYSMDKALETLKKTSYSSFDGTVELAVNLGVDPRHVDQNVRGVAPLPAGRGKDVRIVVFAKGEKALQASQKDVVAVGGEDLVKKIQGGWLEFDQVIASPDMMGLVGKLGRVLGPRGLMPNPKLGTVTGQIAQAIDEFKAGRAEFRVDKAGIVHVAVGKVSMAMEALMENIGSVMEALMRAKPASAKGVYIKGVAVSATMSPGIKVDPASVLKAG